MSEDCSGVMNKSPGVRIERSGDPPNPPQMYCKSVSVTESEQTGPHLLSTHTSTWPLKPEEEFRPPTNRKVLEVQGIAERNKQK